MHKIMMSSRDRKIRHFYILKAEIEGQNAPSLHLICKLSCWWTQFFSPLVYAVSETDYRRFVIFWLQILTHAGSDDVELWRVRLNWIYCLGPCPSHLVPAQLAVAYKTYWFFTPRAAHFKHDSPYSLLHLQQQPEEVKMRTRWTRGWNWTVSV